MPRIAVIDFETTGLRAGSDRIIEVGAAIMEGGEVVGTFSELINPGFRIPSFITQLTGISDAMVQDSPRADAVMPRLRTFLGDAVCVAHNAGFDQRFFTAEMTLARECHDRRFLCTMLLARRLVQDAPSHQLGVLVRHLGLSLAPGLRAHRALDDVLMTCALWTRLNGILSARLHGRSTDLETLSRIMRISKKTVDGYLSALASTGVAQQAS